MPAFTRFVDGTGPVFAGKVFPFCFITIACGAISGFHSLISSRHHAEDDRQGIARAARRLRLDAAGELRRHHGDDRRLLAAAGRLLRVNSPAGVVGATPAAAVATISSWGFPVTAAQMAQLARDVGEKTLFCRTGGAPSLALGMAHIFARTAAAGA